MRLHISNDTINLTAYESRIFELCSSKWHIGIQFVAITLFHWQTVGYMLYTKTHANILVVEVAFMFIYFLFGCLSQTFMSIYKMIMLYIIEQIRNHIKHIECLHIQINLDIQLV